MNRFVSAVAALSILVMASSANAGSAYLKIKASKQGDLKGGAVQKGHEGQMVVVSAVDELTIPRDPGSGNATGRRSHKPLAVTVEADRALPLLLRAATSNEILPEVVLTFYRPSPMGAEGLLYTVKLTNAALANVRVVQASSLDPNTRTQPMLVELQFAYQRIDWTWADGNVTATDSWTGT